jgi:flagellar FliL protein
MAAKSTEPEKAAPASEGGGGGGGIKAWLPLIANVVLMPVLAYLMATKFLAPKNQAEPEPPKAAEKAGEKAAEHGEKAAKSEKSAEHGEKAAEHEEKAGSKKEAESGKSEKGHGGNEKTSVTLSKLLVNVSGTLGTRYIQASLTLVSRNPELKTLAEKNDAQLRDSTSSAISSKTITDLEKPGARNLIRAELINVCNNVLGSGVVSEIYLTEFVIQ